MLGRNEYKALITVYLAIAVAIAMPTLLMQLMLMPSNILITFKISLLVLYAANISISISWQRMPFYHPYVLFLLAFGWFYISPLFLDIIHWSSLAESCQVPDVLFGERTQLRMILSVYLALMGMQLGSILGQKGTRAYFNMDNNRVWSCFGLVFFYCGLPFFIYQHLMMGLEVMENGYAAKVLGELDTQMTMLTTIMSYVSVAGFMVYLASFPWRNWYYLHLSVFILSFSLFLLEGEYFTVISMFLVLVSYCFLRNRRLRERFVLLPLLVMIVVYLASLSLDKTDSMAYGQSLKTSMAHQGAKLETLGFAIDSSRQLQYGFKDVSAPLSYAYDRELSVYTQDSIALSPAQIVRSYPILALEMTQMMSPEALAQGELIERSYLNELYLLLGGFGVFLGNFILGLILVLGFDRLLRTRLGILLSLIILQSIVFVPQTLLGGVLGLSRYIIISVLIIGMASLWLQFSKKTPDEEEA